MASRAASSTDKNVSYDGAGALTRSDYSLRYAATAVAIIGLLHLIGICLFFPPSGWFGPEPFYTNSYAFHYARAIRVSNTIRKHHRLWSYSPSLMAGYPSATRTEPVGSMAALWFLVTPFLPSGTAYKILVLLLLASAPIALFLASRLLELDRRTSVWAAALAPIGVFSIPGLAMIRAGMFSFLSAGFLCLLFGCWIHRAVERNGGRRLVATGALGGLLTYLHPLTAVLLFAPGLTSWIESMRRGRQSFARMTAVFAGIGLIGLGWVLPMVLTAQFAVHFSNWWHTGTTISGGLREMTSPRFGFPALLILLMAIFGVFVAPVAIAPKISIGVWGICFGLIGYFGSMTQSLDNIEPARFEIPFFFFCAPFVAAAAVSVWDRLARFRYGRIIRAWTATAVILYMSVPLRIVILDLPMHGTISAHLPDKARTLEAWIRNSATGARVIVESGWWMNGNQLTLPYFGADLGALWSVETGRELIGGSPSEGFTTFSFVDAGHERIFGKQYRDWSAPDLRAELDRYNVGGVLAWSDEAKRTFSSIPGIVLKSTQDNFAFYDVNGSHSYLMQGTARGVSAGDDCIHVRGAEAGTLVLKYHYFRTLRAEPPLELSAAPAGNADPVPFIKIVNDATRDILIYNAGFSGMSVPRCD